MDDRLATTGFSRGFFGCFGVLGAILAVAAVLFVLFALIARQQADSGAGAPASTDRATVGDPIRACARAAREAHADFKVDRLASDGPVPGAEAAYLSEVGGLKCWAHDAKGAVKIDATVNCEDDDNPNCLAVLGAWRGERLIAPR